MGLFGFGKKKKTVDVDKLTKKANKNFDEVVKNMDFNALLKEREEEQQAGSPVLELTEENFLRFVSEHSGACRACSDDVYNTGNDLRFFRSDDEHSPSDRVRGKIQCSHGGGT